MEKAESELKQLQGVVEDTKVVMVENYNKVIDRGTKLEDSDERTDALLESVPCSVNKARIMSLMCFIRQ
ncbi:hypothetical protein QTP86_025062, partial [Hemibagrus guttatus]